MAISLVTQYAAPRSNVDGATVEVFQDVNFDSSYPTGGYSLTPAMLGLTEILYLDVGSLLGYVSHYDYINQKLQLFQQSAATGKLTEVPNATDVHLSFGRVIAIGKGFATTGLK